MNTNHLILQSMNFTFTIMKRSITMAVTMLYIIGSNINAQTFHVKYEKWSEKIEIFKSSFKNPVLTQNVRPDMRTYLHPVLLPDGKGVLTQVHPDHHPHQTGIYWGLKKVNGRDFFIKSGETHYRKVSAKVLISKGESVSWQTTYDLLDGVGEPILQEIQTWTLSESGGKFLLDLEWTGEGLTDIHIEKFFVGGLFIRMPWFEGIAGEAVNALGENNRKESDGHRAIWADVGMAIEGRKDWGHIAILDHPDNVSFPSPWQIDGQLGIGPSRQILADYHIPKGGIATEKYRLLIYSGQLKPNELKSQWKSYICQRHP